jgi:hypothetical protein
MDRDNSDNDDAGSSVSSRKAILLVLTREIPANPNSGRERTLSFIQRALASRYDVSNFLLTSVAHSPRPGRCVGVLSRLLRGWFQHQTCPLQVAMFFHRRDLSTLFRTIEATHAEAVYFDSVRSVDWLLATRARFPGLRLICDFDDLMSLRFERLLERRLPISLGYLENVTPRWLRGFLKRGAVARMTLNYEARSLRIYEKLAVTAADAVSVVSTMDADNLRANVGPASADKVRVIPPGASFPYSSIRTLACHEFFFVGSDSLLQNRLTIEFLVDLWAAMSPAIPLRIVGRMVNRYRHCDGVRFVGFVQDIGSVYGDGQIALCPSFIEGGIKTKVLEALGHGVIPVGNALTFEGMGCDPGLLAMTDGEIRSLIANPEPMIEQLRKAATRLRECVHQRYSFESVTEAWSRLVSGEG